MFLVLQVLSADVKTLITYNTARYEVCDCVEKLLFIYITCPVINLKPYIPFEENVAASVEHFDRLTDCSPSSPFAPPQRRQKQLSLQRCARGEWKK